MAARPLNTSDITWWRSAVVYQVYIRSFADGNGDGLGDIAGVRSRLDHLADLGVDAIWINPWYPSPMADAGYDVITYRDVEPRFGTLADAEALIAEAHQRGIRVVLDIVPNHCSNLHPWFQAALAAGPGSPERERFVFRNGRSVDGAEPPNDWPSCFGGSAWTRVVEPDGRPGQWYLHLFAPEQPDRNWHHPDTYAEYDDALRFWFDRGVDGFRIDVAHSLFKAEGLPDVGDVRFDADSDRAHPFWDRDEVHDVFRAWRRIADAYDPPRVFVAEAWVPKPDRLARYVRPDELHTTFNFDYLRAPWDAAALRTVIDRTIAEHATVGAPPTWVSSNHDTARHVSRLARPVQGPASSLAELRGDPDAALGAHRARAAVLLMLALPGSAYVYQGEELGLGEVEDLPDEVRQDPTWARTAGADPGRDGCRVPLPWSGTTAPFGFSAAAADPPWLPQPAWFADHTVERLAADPESILHLYRTALRLRRVTPALGDGSMRWRSAADADVLCFERDPGFVCLVNLSAQPVELPAHHALVLASGPLDAAGRVPADTAVWLQR